MGVIKGKVHVVTQIKRWGNSLASRIPVDIAKALGIEEGSAVEMIVNHDRTLTVKPVEKVSLDTLISGVTAENKHEIIKFD